jgi:O-antigen ligase
MTAQSENEQHDSEQPQKEKLPYPCIGIRSFSFALFTVVMLCLGQGIYRYGNVLEKFIQNNWIEDANILLALIIHFVVLGGFVAALLAFVLGIVGIFHSRTRKVFAKWGLCLSILPLIWFSFVVAMNYIRIGACC